MPRFFFYFAWLVPPFFFSLSFRPDLLRFLSPPPNANFFGEPLFLPFEPRPPFREPSPVFCSWGRPRCQQVYAVRIGTLKKAGSFRIVFFPRPLPDFPLTLYPLGRPPLFPPPLRVNGGGYSNLRGAIAFIPPGFFPFSFGVLVDHVLFGFAGLSKPSQRAAVLS